MNQETEPPADEVVDLAAHRARRPRRIPAVHAPTPATPLRVRHPTGAPEAAIVLQLVQARLRHRAMTDGDLRPPFPDEFAVYAHAVGVVLHPDDLAAAAAVRDRLLDAVRDDITDVDSLLAIARDDHGSEPPEAS